jgi:hypothetical protein
VALRVKVQRAITPDNGGFGMNVAASFDPATMLFNLHKIGQNAVAAC